MTGNKKQRGWRGLEEYGEIERVRPQHLPRVTASPQGVLTTAVLAVHCSACLTSTHRAGPWHTAAEDTFKCKEKERAEWDVKSDVKLLFFFFYSPLSAVVSAFSFSDYFSCHFCSAELEQLNGSNNFQQNLPHYQKPFFKVSWGNKSFFGQFFFLFFRNGISCDTNTFYK